jgi:hypothetical protein
VDSTWRWRKEVGDKYFAKFWSQALHYLGKGSLLKKLGGVTIATDKPEYVVGETVTMSARVVDEATLEPSAQDRYTALIQKADSGVAPEETTLAGTGEKGRYEGAWKAKERGTYHAWLRMEGKKEEKPGLRRFEVQLPAREKGDVRIDEKTLISVVTRGGAFLPPSRLGEMAKIPEQVKPVAEARVVQKTQTLWDAAGPLALLVGLLIAEWILRKQKGLA